MVAAGVRGSRAAAAFAGAIRALGAVALHRGGRVIYLIERAQVAISSFFLHFQPAKVNRRALLPMFEAEADAKKAPKVKF